MTRYIPKKLSVKKQDDGRYWLHDSHGVYDGPYTYQSEAQLVADRLNRENGK